MPNSRTLQQRDLWASSLERPVFNVSQSHPIITLPYQWQHRQESRYDMHYGLELGILVKGRMRRFYRDAQCDILPGQVWMCGMWEPHGYQIVEAPSRAVVLIVFPPVLTRLALAPTDNARLLAPFEAPPQSRPQIPPHLGPKAIESAEFFESIIKGDHKNRDAWLNLKLMEILLLLMDHWDAPRTSSEAYSYSAAKIGKAINLVFENRRFVSTQEAAKACGMNRNAFGKRFAEAMGITFSEFGLRYRISAVAEEILKANNPIKKIAADWGFTDTSHLHRCFKKYYGCSPTHYSKSPPVAQ